MDELDALLKTLNASGTANMGNQEVPDYMMGSPNPNGMNSPMYNNKMNMNNNMRFQQEPSPDQSPLKSPAKPNIGMNQYTPQMMSPKIQQPSGKKLQQNNMPNIPFSQKSNLNKLNSPSLNGLNSPNLNKKLEEDKLTKSQSSPNLSSQEKEKLEKPTKPEKSSQKQVRKIICSTCKEQIRGKVVSCLGKTWHPEHFICQGCKKPLDPNRFFEKNHFPCCEECHHDHFTPRCAYCGDPITEKCITALGTAWHTDHFFCCQCAVQFPAGSGFLEKDGKAYCERDYYRLFATRCGKCGEIIVGEYISALGKEWHNKCFTCKECGCSFPTESFYEYKGMPYCETHYHLKRGSLCSRCNKPIVGRCISASGKKYHPDHFTCVKCNKLLATGNMDDEYKEVNGHPFCGNCASRIRF